jgi:hypothetical protein
VDDEVSLTVTAYRVLIELDEELDDERLAFGDTIHDYNFAEALPRDVLFVPIGWDPAVPSAQKLLDDDFEQVDFFVLILWDRWPAGANTVRVVCDAGHLQESAALAPVTLADRARDRAANGST